MKSVHQHPDGMIFVRMGNGETYVDTPDNFARDFGYVLPELPAWASERIYDQGRRHVIAGEDEFGGAKIDGGPMPWPEGDQLIASYDAALTKQKSRKEAAAKAQSESSVDFITKMRG